MLHFRLVEAGSGNFVIAIRLGNFFLQGEKVSSDAAAVEPLDWPLL